MIIWSFLCQKWTDVADLAAEMFRISHPIHSCTQKMKWLFLLPSFTNYYQINMMYSKNDQKNLIARYWKSAIPYFGIVFFCVLNIYKGLLWGQFYFYTYVCTAIQHHMTNYGHKCDLGATTLFTAPSLNFCFQLHSKTKCSGYKHL